MIDLKQWILWVIAVLTTGIVCLIKIDMPVVDMLVKAVVSIVMYMIYKLLFNLWFRGE